MISPAAVLKGVGKLLGGAGKTALRGQPFPQAAFLQDAAKFFPGYGFTTIFDVGANVGDISGFLREAMPDADLHAFEPAPAAFAQLETRFRSDVKLVANDCALAAKAGSLAFRARGVSTSNQPIAKRKHLGGEHAIEVMARCGDGYCAERSIDRISYLKIDTEGYELEVLAGFGGMLGRQAVDFVEAEAGMHPGNRKHVPFEALKSRLEGHGYRLFKLYEQTPDKPAPILRRVNAVFVSLALADAYAGA